MPTFDLRRAPGVKLGLALAVAFLLSIPLFSVWLLVYDRHRQFEDATASITQGWGSEQIIKGPVLVLPDRTLDETAFVDGQNAGRTNLAPREFTLAPETLGLTSELRPEIRRRSIYEAVLYQAHVSGKARFSLPPDLSGTGVDMTKLDLGRAELRFGVSDPRGIAGTTRANSNGKALRLYPGTGTGGTDGFFAWIDASKIASGGVTVEFSYDLRGNRSLSLVPEAGDTTWRVRSSWRSPSFGGEFLPTRHRVGKEGFEAVYGIGNLALGRSLIHSSEIAPAVSPNRPTLGSASRPAAAQVSLIEPVDPYSQVNRATKYGFLFIGLTFLALLMFDVVGGIAVSSVEYLLMGAALVLFFVLLLAFSEVIGFTWAYVIASAAIALLDTAYASAVLNSWPRAAIIGSLLVGLYSLLYLLLTLEAYSLLIGSMLLFVALAAVMYGTRHLDWSGMGDEASQSPGGIQPN